MKELVLLVAFAGMVGVAPGQTPIRFRSTEWLGLSTGEAGSAGLVQTVNGVARGPWFLGAGAGVDYYRFRSAPLFLTVTRDISIGKRDWLYLHFDGGTNVPWYTRPIDLNPGGTEMTGDVFHGGEYWSGGVGYLWKLGDHTSNAVLFSVGYTVKKLSERQTWSSLTPLPFVSPLDNMNAADYTYLNKMYQFMVGFRF